MLNTPTADNYKTIGEDFYFTRLKSIFGMMYHVVLFIAQHPENPVYQNGFENDYR